MKELSVEMEWFVGTVQIEFWVSVNVAVELGWMKWKRSLSRLGWHNRISYKLARSVDDEIWIIRFYRTGSW